ncbi:MAG: hypothetical protein IJW13_06590 [Clostridia bacterium]|nr:hypothetical protein [Clostridia bacterium]
MKTIDVKCTNCGAIIKVEEGKKLQFCNYCGNQIFVEDENTTTTNYNHRYIDEAKVKKIEAEKELQIREEERKSKEKEQNAKTNRLLLIGWVLSLALFLIISLFTMDNVNFSPFQLILILDIIIGAVVIKKRSEKK